MQSVTPDQKEKSMLNAKCQLMLLITLLLICSTPGCVQKQELPVSVDFRRSLLGEGTVAVIKNAATHDMKVLVTVSNVTTKQRKDFVLFLRPLGTREIGWVQGWVFARGETIAVEHDGYARKLVFVP